MQAPSHYSEELNKALADYSKYAASGKGLSSRASLTDDGRISISLNLANELPDLPGDYAGEVSEFATDSANFQSPPCMNIVIMIVGSRGDVQPFVALGKRLAHQGHRVRIATHGTFRSFVMEHGLEFFDIGGNPEDLMSYMVKNPGLVPGLESIKNGDIGRKRKMLKEMLHGCWKACSEPDSESGKVFAANAIISNPPAFAHVHCAEALGIPLTLSFTMPWCATTAFPHPLVNINQSNAKKGLTNYLSYALTDHMTWQGLGDIIDEFREKTLDLRPLTMRFGPGLVDNLKVPWTYCMSPALVPKPKDWKSHIDIVGFYFLDLSTNYSPPDDLATFLAAGPPPIYIGFGSVVVDDPQAMTTTIFRALASTGVRALLSAGWGGIGGGNASLPENVFLLGNVPHDWLFDKVCAVCHHGGAGTTAIGLRMGKPTIVVPFFGDQPFWGEMIHKAGAGPKPIPQKMLTAESLTEAIEFVLKPEAQEAARQMGSQIQAEDGTTNGVLSFYRHLPLLNMRCDLDPNRLAVWWSTQHFLKLSAFAAQTLADQKLIDINKLDLHRASEFDPTRKVTDPVSGGVVAIFWTVTNAYPSINQIFSNPVKAVIQPTIAIPRGVLEILTSLTEGLGNVPRMYGSEVRNTGPVDSLTDGLKKGGKSIFYGYYDTITGFVKEPMQGAKKEGFIGALKGSGRSIANASILPTAGVLGLVVHPLQGAWNSVAKKFAKKPIQVHRGTHIIEGLEHVQASSEYERQRILVEFRKAADTVEERKEKYRTAAKKVLAEAHEEAVQTQQSPSPSISNPRDGPPPPSTPIAASVPLFSSPAPAPAPPGAGSSQLPSVPPPDSEDGEEVEAFLRDLERAKQLSVEEASSFLDRPT